MTQAWQGTSSNITMIMAFQVVEFSWDNSRYVWLSQVNYLKDQWNDIFYTLRLLFYYQ